MDEPECRNMAKVVINAAGDKRYFNDNGDLHREDGPAAIYKNGTKIWLFDGSKNSVDHPSDVDNDGGMWWSVNDLWHRSGGPAIDYPNGHKEWMERDADIWPKL